MRTLERPSADAVSWRVESPQTYPDPWRGTVRTVRYHGSCILCGTRTYGHDDGEDDPRGILGDHASSPIGPDEHGVPAGGEIPACFLCQNDTEERYLSLMRRAKRRAERRSMRGLCNAT